MSEAFGRISKLIRKKSKISQEPTPAQKTPAPTKYEITSEVREILDLVKSRDGKIIFVTGAAGTGKSTLIDILRAETNKKMVVVAPTGVAAINSGGQTIHSFFQLAPEPQPVAKEIRGMNGLVVKNMEVLIIDEVSMVRADLMDSIAASLRLNTRNQQSPFAGMQHAPRIGQSTPGVSQVFPSPLNTPPSPWQSC